MALTPWTNTAKRGPTIQIPIFEAGVVPTGATYPTVFSPFGYTLDAAMQLLSSAPSSSSNSLNGMILRLLEGEVLQDTFFTPTLIGSQQVAAGVIGSYVAALQGGANYSGSTGYGNYGAAYLPGKGEVLPALSTSKQGPGGGSGGSAPSYYQVQEVCFVGFTYFDFYNDNTFDNTKHNLWKPFGNLNAIGLTSFAIVADNLCPNFQLGSAQANIPDYTNNWNYTSAYKTSGIPIYTWKWSISPLGGGETYNQIASDIWLQSFDDPALIAAMNAGHFSSPFVPTAFGFLYSTTTPITLSDGLVIRNLLVNKLGTQWQPIKLQNLGNVAYNTNGGIEAGPLKIDRQGVAWTLQTTSDGKTHITTSYGFNISLQYPINLLTIPTIKLKCFNPCQQFL